MWSEFSRLRLNYGGREDGLGQKGCGGWQNAEQTDPGVARGYGQASAVPHIPFGATTIHTKKPLHKLKEVSIHTIVSQSLIVD